MLRKFFIFFLSVFFSFSSTAFASDQITSFTADQQKDLGVFIHQYLVDHPEILMEMTQQLRTHQIELKQKSAVEKITQNLDQLINSNSPKTGNLSGNVYLIEFFDYQCGHCKEMLGAVDHVLNTNKNLQLVYKNYAVLGPNSELAARVALAANMQGKYNEIHETLMKSNVFSKESMLDIAQKLGLDTKKLEADMYSPKVNDEINSNMALAKTLGIRGTPAFIILSKPAKDKASKIFFLPGSVEESVLQNDISQAGTVF
jgi:protein-disulfide isomerase